MNKILTKRLEDIGISREGILKLLAPSETASVAIYATCMEGLGTQGSDFDIYIIEKKPYEKGESTYAEPYKKEMVELNPIYYGLNNVPYLYLDVEYWSVQSVENIIKDIQENKSVGTEELKLIHRVFRGEFLTANIFEIDKKLCFSEFQLYVRDRFTGISDALLHDAVTQYYGDEFWGAVFCARLALGNAIAGYNCMYGVINFNIEKWCSKIFLGLDIDSKLKKQYLQYMFGDIVENSKEYLESFFVFIQDILHKELSYKGKKHWINKESYILQDESQDILHII